jgi:alpha-L-rhamnosidase
MQLTYTILMVFVVCIGFVSVHAASFPPSATWVQGATWEHTLFRTSFTAPDVIHDAVIYTSGVGAFVHYLDGQRIAPENILDPGTTKFESLSLYTAENIAHLLKPGRKQVLSVELGNGWYGMPLGYDKQPKLRVAVLINGNSWIALSPFRCSLGPITTNSIYNGETYDANLEPPSDWQLTTFDDAAWDLAVAVAPTFAPRMALRDFPAIKVNETLDYVDSWSPAPGILVIDFGREVSGVCQFEVNGTSGSVMLHYGEILNHYDAGKGKFVYFANLRTAKALDTLILKKNATGVQQYTIRPKFTYHGFRFVQVNHTGDARLLTIRALAFFTAVKQTSKFSSSSTVINTLHQHILWGQTANLMSYPTDCNQRDERLGWMADAWLSSDEAVANFEMHAFYRSWVRSIVADQNPLTGAVSDVNPSNFRVGINGDPSWELALPWITRVLFNAYNDSASVAEFYAPVREWWALLIKNEASTGMANLYGVWGDWVPPPPAAKVTNSFVSSFSLLQATAILHELAVQQGNNTDATLTANVLVRQCAAFTAAFFNATTKQYDIGHVQTSFALPLALDAICLDNQVPKDVALGLLDSVEAADYHLDTGIIGLKFLFDGLTDRLNRSDVALSIITQPGYPGYAWEWSGDNETAATTLWEVWDAPDEGPYMDSRNHIMDGSVDVWLQAHVGGGLNKRSDGDIHFDPTIASELTAIDEGSLSRQLPNGAHASTKWRRTGGTVCAEAVVGQPITIDCSEAGGVASIDFASVGYPTGTCRGYRHGGSSACLEEITLAFSKACVGQSRCALPSAMWMSLAAGCGLTEASPPTVHGHTQPLSAKVRAECVRPAEYTIEVNASISVAVHLPLGQLDHSHSRVVVSHGGNQSLARTLMDSLHHQFVTVPVVPGNHVLTVSGPRRQPASTVGSCHSCAGKATIFQLSSVTQWGKGVPLSDIVRWEDGCRGQQSCCLPKNGDFVAKFVCDIITY